MTLLGAANLTDAELVERASKTRPHCHTWDAADWEEKVGVPLLHELARRYERLLASRGSVEITVDAGG